MNVYKSLSLKDCWPYKEVEFEIPKGISTVYGLNRTSRTSRNANGSGKSFLLSQIHEIQFNAPALGTAQDKVRKGNRTLKVLNHKKQEVEINVSGKSSNILVDGKSVAKGATQVSKAISKYIPITRDEFNTYVYFDSRIGHPLVMGSSAERKRFFTSFFQLDRLDAERKIFSAALNALKKDRALYNELRADYRSLEYVDLKPLRAKVKRYRARLEELTELQKESQEQQRYKVFMKSTKKQRKLLTSKIGTITKDSLDALRDSLEKQLEEKRQYERLVARYKNYKEDLAEYEKAIESVNPKFLRYDSKELRQKHLKYLELRDTISSLKTKLSKYMRTEPREVKRPKYSLAECRESLATAKHKLKHAEKFGEGKCPTCGQDVEVDPASAKAAYRLWGKRLEQARAYEAYKQDLEAYEQELKVCKTLRKELKAAVDLAKKLKQFSEAYVAVADLPEKPQVVEKPEKKSFEGLEELLDAIRFIEPNLHMLNYTGKEAVEDYSKELRACSDKLVKLQSKISVGEVNNERIEKLKVRLRELKAKLKDEQNLKILVEGYGDKNIKRMVVRQISQLLMEQVNKYARVVFPESYSFELRWDTQIEIICNRKYGNRVESSDVRKLSGAEYKLFSLVLVMALLAFVPNSKRSSVLVLDEPSANMHEETRQAFISFLDVMVKVIPSIVIITPKSEERYPGRCFTVVKERGYSRLVEGHPSEVA